jgi:hypothetical protein
MVLYIMDPRPDAGTKGESPHAGEAELRFPLPCLFQASILQSF